MVEKLFKDGYDLKILVPYNTDNTWGWIDSLDEETKNNIEIISGDVCDQDLVRKITKDVNIIFHLAANADVRFGVEHPSKDLEQNTIATFNVLEAMRKHNISKIIFASTGAMYGEAKIFPTPEDTSIPIQTSLYGASKLACESMIQAYCEGFNMQAWIFRFVSILGNRYSHGHVYDFCKQLREDPSNLYVLGDGLQRKSYLHIEDCCTCLPHY